MVSPVIGCTIGNTKCAKFCTLSLYAIGTNFFGVKAIGGVSASHIVMALSACWLINLALACVPPPSILYRGMIITGDLVLLTLFDLRVAGAGLVSGKINTGATHLIAGTAPGVLFCVIRWWVHVSFIKNSLVRRVTRFHDRWGIGNSWYCYYVLSFALCFLLMHAIVHPLFARNGWI